MTRFKDLLRRVEDIAGIPFAEINRVEKIEWKPNLASNKGFAAALVDAALGMKADPSRERDNRKHGLEHKTIPLRVNSRTGEIIVDQETKLTKLTPAAVLSQRFGESEVLHKLGSILWIPVVKHNRKDYREWYVRAPFVWLPSTEQMKVLRREYDLIADHLRTGQTEEARDTTKAHGQFVYMYTKRAGTGETKAPEKPDRYQVGGKPYELRFPSAWWLRKRFTTEIMAQNLGYTAPPSDLKLGSS